VGTVELARGGTVVDDEVGNRLVEAERLWLALLYISKLVAVKSKIIIDFQLDHSRGRVARVDEANLVEESQSSRKNELRRDRSTPHNSLLRIENKI